MQPRVPRVRPQKQCHQQSAGADTIQHVPSQRNMSPASRIKESNITTSAGHLLKKGRHLDLGHAFSVAFDVDAYHGLQTFLGELVVRRLTFKV
jgi:hypothetical protein